MGWLAGLWRDVLAAPIEGPEADFHALGGGSLSAAQLVAAMRQRYPQVTVADLYDHPRLGSLAGYLDELDPPPQVETRVVKPTPRLTQAVQVALTLPLATLTGTAVGDLAGRGQQRRRGTEPGAVGGAHRLVVDRRGIPAVRHAAGPDGHRGAVRTDAADRAGARHLPPGRDGAPAGLVRRAPRRGQRRGEPGGCDVAGVLRPRTRQQGRQGRRPAFGAAGDRDAEARSPQFDRARGRPDRTLDRRRPLPRRPDHRRQRRQHRRAHDPAAGGGHRQER